MEAVREWPRHPSTHLEVGLMPLSVDERERFLAEPHIGSLAVARGADRAPLVVPMWYFSFVTGTSTLCRC
jgi:nitroimidazol reductase NimA-like FMN-containing flavoprotein (pyridoxamine 5'-phosphate oxidase superfamily)